jgi:glucokinase
MPIAHSVLCVDIGGTSTKAGVVAADGSLCLDSSIPTGPDAPAFAAALCDLIARTQRAADEAGIAIAGMGVAVAGFLDPARTRLAYNPNLSWLVGFPLRDHLTSRFQIPVELEIDSNAACMAEFQHGAGRGSSRFLCVAAGTGLGAGMTVDGVPLRFAHGCLGDIGHVIVEPDGPLCSCGGRGCAEALISAPAIAVAFRQQTGLPAELGLRDVIAAAERRHPVALALIERAGRHLGIAIASMANILFPDRIAIAGGLSAAGHVLLDAASRSFESSAGTFVRSNVTLALANLGPQATLIGAAWPFTNSHPPATGFCG